MIDKKIIIGVVAAIGATLCCITPVLAVLVGSTAFASSLSWMEMFRPYLISLVVLVLAYAWWDKLKPKKQDTRCACDADINGKVSFWHSKVFLALVSVFAGLMLSFANWGSTLIQDNTAKLIYIQNTTINIEGITCKACEANLENIGANINGVIKIKASTELKNAFVEFDISQTTIQEILKALATTGYQPLSYEENGKKHSLEDKD